MKSETQSTFGLWRPELTIDVDPEQPGRSCLVADSRADGLAPDRSLKVHIAHQPALTVHRATFMAFLALAIAAQTLRTPIENFVVQSGRPPAYLGLQGVHAPRWWLAP